MYPGMRLKRWVFVLLAGMCLFALGLWLVLLHQWGAVMRIAHWTWWSFTAHSTLPPLVVVLLGIMLLGLGLFVAGYGTQKLIWAFALVANPHTSSPQMIRALLEKRRNFQQLRIVGIGGGTGLSTLLRGLKQYPVDLTAIVTVSDDGGSSGRLRSGLDMPPPGDIRNCLMALAETEPLMERLFQHRFASSGHELDGHSLGNLIIAGLSEINGDFLTAIQEVSRVLAVRGRVIPSANQALVLCATMKDGCVVRGETAIVQHKGTIASIGIEPDDATPLPEALEAISTADIIIVGPGSVYSSLLPNLMIPGLAEAVAQSDAIKFFVCNVMTQPGESDEFSASRHLQAVVEQLPCANPFHYAIVNLTRPPREVLAEYERLGQHFVEPDLARILELGTVPVTGALLMEAQLARHDPDKLARCIWERVASDFRLPQILKRRVL